VRGSFIALLVACTCGDRTAEPASARADGPTQDAPSTDGLADLRQGMARCLPEVDTCLADVVADHPDVSGRLAVRVAIQGGVVTSTEIVTDRTGVPAAAACAREVIGRCTFAPGLTDSITLPIAVPPVPRLSPLAPPEP